MNQLNICVAGLGNVGSNLILTLEENSKLIKQKASVSFNILAVSAKKQNKKRTFNTNSYKWCENPLDLIKISNCHVLIELIGEEKGISFEIVKKALENKIHVVTANKALLAINGFELFQIAEQNNVMLLFEAAVAGGIPIINTLKNSLFLNQIKKLKGILNGTTNFILSEMEQKNLSFDEVLKNAQLNGYAEIDPTNDIEGLDAAHKLTLLSSICFCSEINFNNNEISGINGIHIDDILNAKKLGYKIKLISETSIINNQIACVTEPKLIRIDNPLANVNGVLNAINIETDQLKNLFLEGEGAGGKATASSVIADLFIISSNSNTLSLGHKTSKLKAYKKFSSLDIKSSFYMRIMTKDITGVLSKITSYFNESGISIEKILQLPESINKNTPIPIIITTHEVEKNLLINAIRQIEKLDFILEKINIITIDKN